jgi:hypothetical protein
VATLFFNYEQITLLHSEQTFILLSLAGRFNKFLLYLGYTSQSAREVKIGLLCKAVSEFALEYRTTREKLIQQREKKANQRERRKTRGKMIVEVSVKLELM